MHALRGQRADLAFVSAAVAMQRRKTGRPIVIRASLPRCAANNLLFAELTHMTGGKAAVVCNLPVIDTSQSGIYEAIG